MTKTEPHGREQDERAEAAHREPRATFAGVLLQQLHLLAHLGLLGGELAHLLVDLEQLVRRVGGELGRLALGGVAQGAHQRPRGELLPLLPGEGEHRPGRGGETSGVLETGTGSDGVTNLGLVRFAGFVEGLSAVGLFFVAMPLKYAWGMPLAVKIAGSVHGGLFVIFCIALWRVLMHTGWPFSRTVLVVSDGMRLN